MTRSKSYVYMHAGLDGRAFYIGKGTGKRAWVRYNRSEWWKRHVAKHGLIVSIIKDRMPEACAFTLEKIMIAKIGIENLCNKTSGGEGTSGRVPSESQRAKCRMKNKGRPPHQNAKDAARKKTSKPVGTVCGLRFESITEAAKFVSQGKDFKAAKVSISACCRGYKVSQCYGYEFRFLKDGKILESGFQKKKLGKPVKTSTGMKFDSASAATEWLKENGFPKAINSNITQCCKGRVMSAYGYKWEYA